MRNKDNFCKWSVSGSVAATLAAAFPTTGQFALSLNRYADYVQHESDTKYNYQIDASCGRLSVTFSPSTRTFKSDYVSYLYAKRLRSWSANCARRWGSDATVAGGDGDGGEEVTEIQPARLGKYLAASFLQTKNIHREVLSEKVSIWSNVPAGKTRNRGANDSTQPDDCKSFKITAYCQVQNYQLVWDFPSVPETN